MNPGRILGIVAGIIILVAAFTLPFGQMDGATFFGIVSPLFGNLGVIQQSGDQALIGITYVYIVSLILLVIAGVVGFFPLGSGVIGIIAMAILTVAPIVIFPGTSFVLSDYGIGYFVAWAASIVALAASFWKARLDKATVAVTVNAPPPPPPTEVNVNPTITMTQTQITGEDGHARPVEAKNVELPHLEGETTPEEVVGTLNSLKYMQSSGVITSEQLRQELSKMVFTDSSDKYWTIDNNTGRWVYHDGTKWVEGVPPPTLKVGGKAD